MDRPTPSLSRGEEAVPVTVSQRANNNKDCQTFLNLNDVDARTPQDANINTHPCIIQHAINNGRGPGHHDTHSAPAPGTRHPRLPPASHAPAPAAVSTIRLHCPAEVNAELGHTPGTRWEANHNSKHTMARAEPHVLKPHRADSIPLIDRATNLSLNGGHLRASPAVGSSALRLAPTQYKTYIDRYWPQPTHQARIIAPWHMDVYARVKATGLPNYMQAKVGVPSDLNCGVWEEKLADYYDSDICQFLRYGWPSSYTAPTPPQPSFKNHASALNYPVAVENFLQKETSLNAMLGPFPAEPFFPWTQVSPLMTRPKKDVSVEASTGDPPRRVITNLSFPENASVNDGIARNFFQGENTAYSLPTVIDLANDVAQRGKGCLMWKTDLQRAYRQLRVDPLDYPLLAIQHKGATYLDICPSFGCRSSGTAQQRVSNAVCHLMRREHGADVRAYVDDFIGLNNDFNEAVRTFAGFESLCDQLGLKIAAEKSVYPTTRIEWLGISIDSEKMETSIPKDKLREVIAECTKWASRDTADRRDLQSLCGRLNHIAQCVRPARRYMNRILQALREARGGRRIHVDEEFLKDIRWFIDYAEQTNGKQLIRKERTTIKIECDACLTGAGAFSESTGTFYNIRFPLKYKRDHHISQLEAINAVLAVKTLLPPDVSGVDVLVVTDNISSMYALNSGRTRDPILAACARELALIEALQNVTITLAHAAGSTLILADSLSRAFVDKSMNILAETLVNNKNLTFKIPVSLKYVLSPT